MHLMIIFSEDFGPTDTKPMRNAVMVSRSIWGDVHIRFIMCRKLLVVGLMVVASLIARADYWMTFCKTLDGRQYSQIGYVQPDDEGFVTIKAGSTTVVVYKTQVWYQKFSGEAPTVLR